MGVVDYLEGQTCDVCHFFLRRMEKSRGIVNKNNDLE